MILFLLCAATVFAAAPCAECHGAIGERHARSHHAQALRPIERAGVAERLSQRSIAERGGATLEYTIQPGGLNVEARRDGETATARLEWAFGAGAQGVTPVGRIGGRYFESRISYYTKANRLARTFGHPVAPSSTAEAALGLIQPPETIYRCFNCHAYGVKSGPDLSAMNPGVTCERCHGAGEAHERAVKAGQPRRGILNPGSLPAQSVVSICAECHRSPAGPSAAPELEDPVSVRFAPVGLMASRCFQQSHKLSCLTCHNPHENARPRSDAYYSRQCLSCHMQPPRGNCQRARKQDCLPCHMAQTSVAPHLMFTDHRIRVLSRQYPRRMR